MRYLLIFSLSACGVFHTKDSRQSEYILSDADKSQSFNAKDSSQVLKVFEKVLLKEGYEIKNLDEKAGTLQGRADDSGQLRKGYSSFNSGFVGGSNYKVSDSIEVNVKIIPEKEGVASYLSFRKIEKFSMGQEESQDLNDPALYKGIFSKVSLEL